VHVAVGVAVGHSPVHVGVGIPVSNTVDDGVAVGHSPVQVGVGDAVSVGDAVGLGVGVPPCSEIDGNNTTSNATTTIRAPAATRSQIFLPSFVDPSQIVFSY
jgi:hypothetical protein